MTVMSDGLGYRPLPIRVFLTKAIRGPVST
jgi:hypothetical protein